MITFCIIYPKYNKKGVENGVFHSFLGGIQFILLPLRRVIFDVTIDVIVVGLAADNVVVEGCLK